MALQAIKIRLYPTSKQGEYISRLLGSVRFAYNKALEFKIATNSNTGKYPGFFRSAEHITKLRNSKEFSWLADVHTKPIRQALLDLESAFSNFFNKKNDYKFPVFKTRKDKQSCRFIKESFSEISGNRISLIRELANIEFKCSKYDNIYLNANQNIISSLSLERTKSGKYTLSILIDKQLRKKLPKTNKVVGLDIGIKDFVVTSDGERFENIKIIRNNEKKLKKLQRQHSKKQKGSKNKEKARLKLAKFHEKLTNQKEHYIHQISNKLLNENQVIVFETLNIKGMMANHALAKAIGELSASRFKIICKYKVGWYDRDFVEIDQYFPSSKLCECCNFKNDKLTLKDRTWICPSCGVEHDRDLNAARNIRNEGIRLLQEKYKSDPLKLSILGLSSANVKSVERTTKISKKQKKNVVSQLLTSENEALDCKRNYGTIKKTVISINKQNKSGEI